MCKIVGNGRRVRGINSYSKNYNVQITLGSYLFVRYTLNKN